MPLHLSYSSPRKRERSMIRTRTARERASEREWVEAYEQGERRSAVVEGWRRSCEDRRAVDGTGSSFVTSGGAIEEAEEIYPTIPRGPFELSETETETGTSLPPFPELPFSTVDSLNCRDAPKKGIILSEQHMLHISEKSNLQARLFVLSLVKREILGQALEQLLKPCAAVNELLSFPADCISPSPPSTQLSRRGIKLND
ncbi:hypothetical protein GW17_00037574 [Ensete ventricosum]|nr:hypothetical protein GW17_00037574 [Ensete ventricosum]